MRFSDKVGLYWKAVIEEFCELPYSEREKIYQKEYWSSILSAIARKKEAEAGAPQHLPNPCRKLKYLVFQAAVHIAGFRKNVQLPDWNDAVGI